MLAREVGHAVEARREDAMRLLGTLVRVPPLTGSGGAFQELVEEELRTRGLAAERVEVTLE